MQFRIAHRTTYRYQETVKYTAQALRLTPRREGGQRVLTWSIQAPGHRTEQLDAHGNVTHLLTFEQPHREIAVVVNGTVELFDTEDILRHEGALSPLTYVASTPLTAPSEEIVALARKHLGNGGALPEGLYDLARGVCANVRYRPGTTSVDDAASVALARGEGVCQDQTHVFIACCRAAGIPARYVSGYLCAGVSGREGAAGGGARGDGGLDAGGSATASHAWADVWIADRRGWQAIDVTHGVPAAAGHCRLAVGRDYLDAAPVRGVRRGGGPEVMEVSVTATGRAEQ